MCRPCSKPASTVALMQKSVMMPQTITSFSSFSVRYSSRPLSFFERTAYSLDEPFFSQQGRKPGIDLKFIVPDGKACTGPIVMLNIDDLDSLFAGSPD